MLKLLKKKNLVAFILSALGTCFFVYYIFRASEDVVASDYIRIINSYLPNVKDIHYLLSWEAISRIPFAFLARFINKTYFHYSVYFDKILGTLGPFLFNFITVKHILNTFKNDYMKLIASVIATLVSFSLMSWEMILNGTGYPHFLTCGLIALVFYLFDRIAKRTKAIMTFENLDSSDLKYYGNEKENNRLSNMVALIDTSQMQRNNLRAHAFVYLLVVVTTLLFAGDYGVGFICTIIFFSIVEIFVFIAIRNKYNRGEMTSFSSDKKLYDSYREQYNSQEIRSFGSNKGEKYSTVNNETTFKIFVKFLILIIISVICLLCYFKSSYTGEALLPVGAKDISLLDVIKDDPKFPLRFMLKSLASAIIGTETFSYALSFGTITENMIFVVGFIYMFIILITIIILFVKLFTKKSTSDNLFDINTYRSIFPLMYVVLGLGNFALVFLARYKFLRDEYGMSSRYGIQYLFFTMGILLILMSFIDDVWAKGLIYVKSKRELKLSKTYLKKREKLIAEGKLKIKEDKISPFYVIAISFSIFSICVLLLGHITTTMDEIFKADYRKIAYNNLVKIAKEYDIYNDEELINAFEYRRSADHIRNALKILKDNNLNIWYKK